MIKVKQVRDQGKEFKNFKRDQGNALKNFLKRV